MRLRRELGARVELEQAAREAAGGGEQLELEGEHRVRRLQVAVREVRGELDVALRVGRLLARELEAHGGRVLAADGQQLLELAHLLAALDDGERRRVDDADEGL